MEGGSALLLPVYDMLPHLREVWTGVFHRDMALDELRQRISEDYCLDPSEYCVLLSRSQFRASSTTSLAGDCVLGDMTGVSAEATRCLVLFMLILPASCMPDTLNNVNARVSRIRRWEDRVPRESQLLLPARNLGNLHWLALPRDEDGVVRHLRQALVRYAGQYGVVGSDMLITVSGNTGRAVGYSLAGALTPLRILFLDGSRQRYPEHLPADVRALVAHVAPAEVAESLSADIVYQIRRHANGRGILVQIPVSADAKRWRAVGLIAGSMMGGLRYSAHGPRLDTEAFRVFAHVVDPLMGDTLIASLTTMMMGFLHWAVMDDCTHMEVDTRGVLGCTPTASWQALGYMGAEAVAPNAILRWEIVRPALGEQLDDWRYRVDVAPAHIPPMLRKMRAGEGASQFTHDEAVEDAPVGAMPASMSVDEPGLLPSGLEGVDRSIDSEALPDETHEMGLSAANVPTACDYPGEMMRHGHTILPNILHDVAFTDEDKEYLATTTAWESILNEYTVESRYTDQPTPVRSSLRALLHGNKLPTRQLWSKLHNVHKQVEEWLSANGMLGPADAPTHKVEPFPEWKSPNVDGEGMVILRSSPGLIRQLLHMDSGDQEVWHQDGDSFVGLHYSLLLAVMDDTTLWVKPLQRDTVTQQAVSTCSGAAFGGDIPHCGDAHPGGNSSHFRLFLKVWSTSRVVDPNDKRKLFVPSDTNPTYVPLVPELLRMGRAWISKAEDVVQQCTYPSQRSFALMEEPQMGDKYEIAVDLPSGVGSMTMAPARFLMAVSELIRGDGTEALVQRAYEVAVRVLIGRVEIPARTAMDASRPAIALLATTTNELLMGDVLAGAKMQVLHALAVYARSKGYDICSSHKCLRQLGMRADMASALGWAWQEQRGTCFYVRMDNSFKPNNALLPYDYVLRVISELLTEHEVPDEKHRKMIMVNATWVSDLVKERLPSSQMVYSKIVHSMSDVLRDEFPGLRQQPLRTAFDWTTIPLVHEDECHSQFGQCLDAALAWSMGKQVHFFQEARRRMHCTDMLPPDTPNWATCAIPAERMAEVAQLVRCHLVIIHHDRALAIGSTPESHFFPSASRDVQHDEKVALLYLRQARNSNNALELHLLPVDTRQMPKSLEGDDMDASDGHLMAADACARQLLRLGIAARWGSELTYETSLLTADQHDRTLLNGMCAGDAPYTRRSLMRDSTPRRGVGDQSREPPVPQLNRRRAGQPGVYPYGQTSVGGHDAPLPLDSAARLLHAQQTALQRQSSHLRHGTPAPSLVHALGSAGSAAGAPAGGTFSIPRCELNRDPRPPPSASHGAASGTGDRHVVAVVAGFALPNLLGYQVSLLLPSGLADWMRSEHPPGEATLPFSALIQNLDVVDVGPSHDINAVLGMWMQDTGMSLIQPGFGEPRYELSDEIQDPGGQLLGEPCTLRFLRVTVMPPGEVGLQLFRQLATVRPTVYCRHLAYVAGQATAPDEVTAAAQGQLLRALHMQPVCTAPLPSVCGPRYLPASVPPVTSGGDRSERKLRDTPMKQYSAEIVRLPSKPCKSLQWFHDALVGLEVNADSDMVAFLAAQAAPVLVLYGAFRHKLKGAQFTDLPTTAISLMDRPYTMVELEELGELYRDMVPIPTGMPIPTHTRERLSLLHYDVVTFIIMTIHQLQRVELLAEYAQELTQFQPSDDKVGVQKLRQFVDVANGLSVLAGPIHFATWSCTELKALPARLKEVLDPAQMQTVLDVADRYVQGLSHSAQSEAGIEGLRTSDGDVVNHVSTLFDLRCLFEAGHFGRLMNLLDKKLCGEPLRHKNHRRTAFAGAASTSRDEEYLMGVAQEGGSAPPPTTYGQPVMDLLTKITQDQQSFREDMTKVVGHLGVMGRQQQKYRDDAMRDDAARHLGLQQCMRNMETKMGASLPGHARNLGLTPHVPGHAQTNAVDSRFGGGGTGGTRASNFRNDVSGAAAARDGPNNRTYGRGIDLKKFDMNPWPLPPDVQRDTSITAAEKYAEVCHKSPCFYCYGDHEGGWCPGVWIKYPSAAKKYNQVRIDAVNKKYERMRAEGAAHAALVQGRVDPAIVAAIQLREPVFGDLCMDEQVYAGLMYVTSLQHESSMDEVCMEITLVEQKVQYPTPPDTDGLLTALASTALSPGGPPPRGCLEVGTASATQSSVQPSLESNTSEGRAGF